MCHGDIEFIDIFKLKQNRNKTNLPFKVIEKMKLLLCADHGIATAKELLSYDGGILRHYPSGDTNKKYDNLCSKWQQCCLR